MRRKVLDLFYTELLWVTATGILYSWNYKASVFILLLQPSTFASWASSVNSPYFEDLWWYLT